MDCLVPPLRTDQADTLQGRQGKPSQTLPCLSVLLSGHPPCSRLIASQSASQPASLSLTLPGPRTKYPRTFQVLSHFAFAFRWPHFASQLVDIVWRCDEADRDRSSAWSKGSRQTTTAANPNANPSYSPCPPVPVPGHVRALLWLLCLALVLAVPLCVCLRTTCSPWTLQETSWCVRLARSSFNSHFPSQALLIASAPSRDFVQGGVGRASEGLQRRPHKLQGTVA